MRVLRRRIVRITNQSFDPRSHLRYVAWIEMGNQCTRLNEVTPVVVMIVVVGIAEVGEFLQRSTHERQIEMVGEQTRVLP